VWTKNSEEILEKAQILAHIRSVLLWEAPQTKD
jgi:hypothetical protein